MRSDVRLWSSRRSSQAADWPLADLLAAKGSTRVSVVFPALDEEQTVGDLVRLVRRELMDAAPLVDELVVMDSGSTDRTAEVAAAAGARVVHRDDVLPEVPVLPGKGEVLWRSLAATSGDVVLFADSDLTGVSSSWFTGLLGPLLTDPQVHLVKAAADRPLAGVSHDGGGRVTELVARPLLALHWPELTGFVQPLAGEYAARRSLLERLPFPTGYGVELALLIDSLGAVGLDGLAQVDVGTRQHSHQSTEALGAMAAQVWQAALARLPVPAPVAARPSLLRFSRSGTAGFTSTSTDVTVTERPPMITMPGYLNQLAR